MGHNPALFEITVVFGAVGSSCGHWFPPSGQIKVQTHQFLRGLALERWPPAELWLPGKARKGHWSDGKWSMKLLLCLSHRRMLGNTGVEWVLLVRGGRMEDPNPPGVSPASLLYPPSKTAFWKIFSLRSSLQRLSYCSISSSRHVLSS